MPAILLALMAAVGFGASPVFARIGLLHMRPTTGTVVSLAAGSALVATVAFAVHGAQILAFHPTSLLWFALLGSLNYLGGRYFNFISVHLAGVSRAAPILSTSPLVAAAWSIGLGGETLTPTLALGTVIIVGGVMLILGEKAIQ